MFWLYYRIFLLLTCSFLIAVDIIPEINERETIPFSCSEFDRKQCAASSFCLLTKGLCGDLPEFVTFELPSLVEKENTIYFVNDTWFEIKKNNSVGSIHMTPSYEVILDILPGTPNKKWTNIFWIGNEQGFRQPGVFFRPKKMQIVQVRVQTRDEWHAGCEDINELLYKEEYRLHLKVTYLKGYLYINEKLICEFPVEIPIARKFQNVFISNPFQDGAWSHVQNVHLRHLPLFSDWISSKETVLMGLMDSHSTFDLSFEIIPQNIIDETTCLLLLGNEEVYAPKVLFTSGTTKLKFIVADSGQCTSKIELPLGFVSKISMKFTKEKGILSINGTISCKFDVGRPVDFTELPFVLSPSGWGTADVFIRNVFFKPGGLLELHPIQPFYMDCIGAWSSWGSCSEECGGGTKTRKIVWGNRSIRTIKNGLLCRPVEGNSKYCNSHDCGSEKPEIIEYNPPSCDETNDRSVKLIGCDWIDIEKSKMFSEIDTLEEYSLTMELYPTGLMESLSNIIQIGNFDAIKAPSLYFRKRTTQLALRMTNPDGKDTYCESSLWLEIDRNYFINITSFDGKMTLAIDDKVWCVKRNVYLNYYPNQFLYISSPHHHAALARVRNMKLTFFKDINVVSKNMNDKYYMHSLQKKVDHIEKEISLSGTLASDDEKCKDHTKSGSHNGIVQIIGCNWITSIRGLLLAQIDIPRIFKMKLDIRPLAHSKKFANILKIGSHEDIHYPSLWFKKETLTLVVQVSTKDEIIECMDPDELVMGVVSTVTIEITSDSLKVSTKKNKDLDQIVCEKNLSNFRGFEGQAIFSSSPSDYLAEVELTNFKIYFDENMKINAEKLAKDQGRDIFIYDINPIN